MMTTQKIIIGIDDWSKIDSESGSPVRIKKVRNKFEDKSNFSKNNF